MKESKISKKSPAQQQKSIAAKGARPQKTRGGTALLLSVWILIVIALGVGGYTVHAVLDNLGSYKVQERQEPYDLKAGMTVSSVVRDLSSDKFSSLVQTLWLKFYGKDYAAIQKGLYRIDGSKTLKEILDDMVQGKVFVPPSLQFALVEGLSLPLLLKRFKGASSLADDSSECIGDIDSFVKEAMPEDLGSLYPKLDSLEGLFLPATYPYYEHDTACTILKSSFAAMAKFVAAQWEERDESVPVKTPYEAVIIASIIERESSLDAERPLIAEVFYNRLRQNIRLQTDAAVMYGVGADYRRSLKRSHLRTDTPYNTYTRYGLPPTPIAMPSKSSIIAALHPKATDALYFVAKSADPLDGHIFSATLKEHNQAVKQYRAKVKEYKQSLAKP